MTTTWRHTHFNVYQGGCMIEQHVQKYFGFTTFKKGQKEVIQKVLNNESAAAIFPTGAGKSLCYQLPAMLLPDTTLVVSPLLSLMKDQLDFLLEHNIPAARLDSTLDKDAYTTILEKAKHNELKILMVSVERFRNERFRLSLQKMNISLLVVDEAHCISEWGHNFRPEYLKLPAYQKEFKIPQTLLLTATATEQVIDDMCAKFNIRRDNVVVTGFYRKNLFLQITPTYETAKKATLLKRIQEESKAPTIVYVTLQKTAEDVAAFLCTYGIHAHAYHAGMETDEREQIQNQFMGGTLDCIVATIAFGMGVDKKNIRRVIHYDMPKSLENYSQEIGRSGRDGAYALCEVLANRDGITVLENFIYGDTPEKNSIRRLLQTIKQHPQLVWEVKVITLSNMINIKILPLKTLLVYLDMQGIIRPKLTYFAEYAFKYRVDPPSIIAKFQGERKQFVHALIKNCYTKKIWTSVDFDGILQTYTTDRQRIIAALEYFDAQGWIEVQARQATDVYDILTQTFNVDELTETLYRLFKEKETYEIQRIHTMLSLFERESCTSKELAAYFGEYLEQKQCGHCSFCTNGKVTIQHTNTLPPLAKYNGAELAREFTQSIGEHASPENVTKFLCGIHTPLFSKGRIKKLQHFGILEQYPFGEVKDWVEKHRFLVHH